MGVPGRLPVLLLVLALVSVSASEIWLETHPSAPESELPLYLPNGKFLQVASLGYSTFIADLVYLWSIQYYSNYEGHDRVRFLDHVYGTVTARLDPHFVDPYLIGSLIMVLENDDLEGGLRLLEQGLEANPEEWILPYEAGFFAYDIGHDYERAAGYFRQAMDIPGAPASTSRLHAEMYNKKGDKASSLQLWREVLESAADPKVVAVAANHVHDLTIDVDLLELSRAVAAYRQRHGAGPARLDVLVETGDLETLPVDPDGKSYAYNPRTGAVSPEAGFRLRRN